MYGAEWTPVHQPDRCDVRNPLQAIEEIPVKDVQPRHIRIGGFREIEVERNHLRWCRNRIYGLKPELLSSNPARQQHQRDGDLADDERAPQTLLAGTERPPAVGSKDSGVRARVARARG